MSTYYVNKIYRCTAWLAGLLCIVSGIAVSIHFSTFSPIILTSLAAFLVAMVWSQPYIILTKSEFTYHYRLAQNKSIERSKIMNVNVQGKKIIIKTETEKYTVSLFFLNHSDREDILNKM